MNFSELMLAINSHFDENLSRQEVMSILKRSEKYNSCIQEKFSSTTIYGDKDEIVNYVLNSIANKEAEKLEQEKLEEELKNAVSKVLITSGYSFEGYKIIKYSGYISGDDVTQIPRSISTLGIGTDGKIGSNLTDALVKIRIQALKELKEAAVAMGCNAVIGVDFDYITLEPETSSIIGNTRVLEPYVICVTANGNAVLIEKID